MRFDPFSRRTRFARVRNAVTVALAEVEEELPREQWCDLTVSNPTRVGLGGEMVRVSLSQPVDYRPSAWGLDEARAAVAAYYRDHGVEVEPQRILLTASTSESYSYLFKLLG
ncbi:MAG: pyridoxal phosphate-dependent aminotransferase, partial [Myxococcota bacterium]